MICRLILAIRFLIKSTLSIYQFALCSVLDHNYLEANSAKLYSIPNAQVKTPICGGDFRCMKFCKFYNLPCFVRWLDFLFLIVFDQKLVVDPEITYG